MPDRPLVTFGLFAYNQEEYVREAIEGALAQTYHPLEIVMSDDASTDGTFEVMRQIASAYRGPHRLVLNRNPQNLGMGGHVNVVGALASGHYFVFAAGDDVSLPDRTSATVSPFLRPGAGDLWSVSCDFTGIDSASRAVDILFAPWDEPRVAPRAGGVTRVSRFIDTLRPYSPGCVHTCRRSLLLEPGPLSPAVRNEDAALSFRAHLFGRLEKVHQSHTLYRVHSKNQSRFATDALAPGEIVQESQRRLRMWYRDAGALYEGFAKDMSLAGYRTRGINSVEREQLLTLIRRRREAYQTALAQDQASIWSRLVTPLQLHALGAPVSMIRASVVAALPPRMARRLRLFRSHVRQAAAQRRSGGIPPAVMRRK